MVEIEGDTGMHSKAVEVAVGMVAARNLALVVGLQVCM